MTTRDEITVMDEDALRLAVAKALGYKFVNGAWMKLKRPDNGNIIRDPYAPDWPRDIAAAFELEAQIPEGATRNKYVWYLNWIINRHEDTSVDPRWQFAHASAADRCRAWLMWKGEE